MPFMDLFEAGSDAAEAPSVVWISSQRSSASTRSDTPSRLLQLSSIFVKPSPSIRVRKRTLTTI